MKVILLLTLMVTHLTNTLAQPSKKDPKILRRQLTENSGNQTGVGLLIDLGTFYMKKPGELKADLDSATHFQKRAMALAEQLKYPEGIGMSLLLEGEILSERKDRDKSLSVLQKAADYGIAQNFHEQVGTAYRLMSINFGNDGEDLGQRIYYLAKAIPYFQKSSARLLQAQSLETLGELYMLNDEHLKALGTLRQALATYNAIGHKETQGVYSLLGYASFGNRDNVKAVEYLVLALKVSERQNDTSSFPATIYNRLGMIYLGLEKLPESAAAFKKGIIVAEATRDSAATMYLKANLLSVLIAQKQYADAELVLKNIDIPHANAELRTAVTYAGASIYLYLKKYKRAASYIDSLQKFTVQFPGYEQAWQHYYIASMKYRFETGQYESAKREIMDQQVAGRFHHNKKFLMSYELFSSKIDSALGDDASSLRHYKDYSILKDSMATAENNKQLAELSLKYDTERKDKDIALLTTRSQLQQTQIRSQHTVRNAIVAGMALLLISLGLLYNRYMIKQQANEKLETKQAEINGQNRQLQRLLQDKEWLLKEIHHRVKNNLQVIISLLSTQSAFLNNADAKTAIQNSQHRIQAISLIHQKLYQSDNTTGIQMNWYVQELVGLLEDSFSLDGKVAFHLDTDSVIFDVSQAVPLGLILNEGITNAIKYAFPGPQKGEISVSIKQEPGDSFLLRIADNGIGLPTGFDPFKSGSIGMRMIRGLSEQLDGDLRVKSENGLILEIIFKGRAALSEPVMQT